MRFIAHRGNTEGPKPQLENSPAYIDKALTAGFEVEVDLRVKNGKFYLGHDLCQNPVDLGWLQDRDDRLLLHLKDIETLNHLISFGISASSFHYFCHSNDPFTFTSHGLIWLHDTSLPAGPFTIVPLITPEQGSRFKTKDQKFYAICSDFAPKKLPN
jgi:hypothetical protein